MFKSICILILLSTTAFAENRHEEIELPIVPGGVIPGFKPWAKPATPGMLSLKWESYETTIVILESHGNYKAAIVATYEAGTYNLAALYSANAYVDEDNNLHISAWKSKVVNASPSWWNPDSFLINMTTKTLVRCDAGSSVGVGNVVESRGIDDEYRNTVNIMSSLLSGAI
jgi:hypothetical protein